jgi:putative acetyltransferase
VRIVDGADPDHVADAAGLVFEYMAATLAETGRRPAADPGDLPAVLRAECEDLPHYYRPPGILLVAYQDTGAAGCVGLASGPAAGAGEIKRLYVRPAHRGRGIARALMDRAHSHAVMQGLRRVQLDVLPARAAVIQFYRRLGYVESGSGPGDPDSGLLYLEISLPG